MSWPAALPGEWNQLHERGQTLFSKLITENSPCLAAQSKICPLEAINYGIFLKHLIVLGICCKGWLAISSGLEQEALQSSSNLRNSGVNLRLISYFGFFRQNQNKSKQHIKKQNYECFLEEAELTLPNQPSLLNNILCHAHTSEDPQPHPRWSNRIFIIAKTNKQEGSDCLSKTEVLSPLPKCSCFHTNIFHLFGIWPQQPGWAFILLSVMFPYKVISLPPGSRILICSGFIPLGFAALCGRALSQLCWAASAQQCLQREEKVRREQRSCACSPRELWVLHFCSLSFTSYLCRMSLQ